MTDDKIALRALMEKGSDATFLRDLIGFAAERLMQLETEALCGAAPGERSTDRINAGKTQRRIVSACIGTAFAQDDAAAARKQWREVADQVRPLVPRLATLMDDAEVDVLAYMGFQAEHRAKLHSTKSTRAPQRRDQASQRSRRDLPERGRRNAPDRRLAAGAE